MNKEEDQRIRRNGRQSGEKESMSGEEDRMIREKERQSREEAQRIRESAPLRGEDAAGGAPGPQEAPVGRRVPAGRRPPSPRPGGQRGVGDPGARRRGRSLRRHDSMAALSALSREARRRRVSYGTLCRQLTGEEREALLRAWTAEHPPRAPGGERCEGCAYWRDASATSPELGKLCHFALDHGRARRRDGGRCLEYREGEGELSSGAALWRARANGRRGPSV